MNILMAAALSFLVNWSPPPAEEGVDSALVFRTVRGSVDTVQIGSTVDTFFLDTRIQSNQRYIYLVRFKRGETLGPWSNDVSGGLFAPEGMYLPADTMIVFRKDQFTSHDLLLVQCQGVPSSVTWDLWGGITERVVLNCAWNNWGGTLYAPDDDLDISDLSGLPLETWSDPKAQDAFLKYYNRVVRYEGVIK